MPASTDIQTVTSDKVQELYDWWMSARGDNRVPDRSAFDPTRFARLLPNMMIVEVEQQPFRIRYRLVGTKVADVLNIDFTGRDLDEFNDAATDTPWQAYYARSFADRMPLFGSVTERTLAGDTFTFEFGIFPVTAGGSEIQQFLSVEDYFGFSLTSAELVPWTDRTAAA